MTDLSHLKPVILKNNTIDESLYSKYEVKRGLRNADGTGVLAGLTRISSVIGAKKIDYQQIPVEGDLRYRGKSIFDVLETFDPSKPFLFEKTAYLLLIGEDPSEKDLKVFTSALSSLRALPDALITHAIKGIPSKNIMNKLQTSISALYAFDADADSLDPYENFLKSLSLIAKTPLIIAYSYLSAFKKNPKFVMPSDKMCAAEAFLYVLKEGEKVSKEEIEIMDLALALHAEHGGGNNSTFTTYVVSSSGTDMYSAIAAAIASLKGPLHGSANQKVMDMMADVKKNVKKWDNKQQVRDYLAKLINKEAHDKSGKIYGLGHAVYTKSDPRAIILKEKAKELAHLKNRSDELNLYFTIEEEGPKLFHELKGSDKVIAPNVDFFAGFVYDCLGIPADIYTPIFAMSRIVGWCAHRIEEILSGKRIIRPGYKYISD